MDEDQLYQRLRNQPRYDKRHPIGSELEFIMEQLAALPTRRGADPLWRLGRA